VAFTTVGKVYSSSDLEKVKLLSRIFLVLPEVITYEEFFSLKF